MQKLTPEQYGFYKQISELAFVNPFSRQREEADCRLLNIQLGEMDIIQRNEKIQGILLNHFQNQQPFSEFKLTSYPPQQRETLKFCWLFYQFHQFQQAFNQHIESQNLEGDKSSEVIFAKEIIGVFNKAEFTEEETEKYIALFYQLHRGYYFISTAISGDCPSIIELRMQGNRV